MSIETSAGAVVFYRGEQIEYLLLYHNFWGFPKGHIERGEDEHTAALREIDEEAGVPVTLLDGFRWVEEYEYPRRGKLNPKRAIYFLAQARNHTARLSWEHTELTWLPYEQALAQLQFDGLRDTLRAANEFLTKREP
jgi:bis(5'-nucleosidyl)-tetraphosphatase